MAEHEDYTSALGTKYYWDNAYSRELVNYRDTGDIGEVWFGYSSQTRVVKWLSSSPRASQEARILDIGCGNGAVLVELAEHGFMNLTGIDYSEGAIQLARQVTGKERISAELMVADILDIDSSPLKGMTFNICLDKGTYDAIGLHPDNPEVKRAVYVRSVAKLLDKDGLFVIVSCNWTEDELKAHFEEGFVCVATIPGPKLQFGGRTGQTVSSIVFQRTA